MLRKLISAALLSCTALAFPAQAQLDPEARGLASKALTTRTWKNLSEFGVKYNVNVDQSADVNAAFASGNAINCTGTVYLDATITIPSGLVLQGNGPGGPMWFSPNSPGCVFQAMAGMSADMVHLGAGQVRFVTIRDVSFNGVSTNTGQNGLVLIGSVWSGSGSTGGMWEATFENINIFNFDGVSLGLLGGCTLQTTPIQYVSFKNLTVFRPNSGSGAALYATGQVEHIHLDSSQLSGVSGLTSGTDVYLGRSDAASCSQIGAYGSGTALSSVAPSDWKMTNSSTENASQAMIVDYVSNLTVESQWVEQTNAGFLFQNNATATLINNHFTNAALTGIAVSAVSGAEVSILGTQLPQGTSATYLSTDGYGSILTQGISGTQPVNNIEWDQTYSTTGSQTIITRGAPGIYPGATVAGVIFNGINSDLAPGQTFTIKVKPSSANGITLSNTGAGSYLYLMNLGNGVSSVTLNAGDTAVLLRTAGPTYGWEYLGKH